jgi:class 3 adenylate cyclase
MVVVDIVGRIAQRAQLSRWLAAAINGQPAVIVLDGPPGIGKSTMVDWLVGQAADRGATHRIVVVPETGEVADDLRRHIAETDEQMRRGTPQLVIIDDAHWLDDAAQHVVEHLAFRLGTAAVAGQAARVCLLLVSREGGSSRLISRLVDEPIIRRMSLAELDDRESLELARRISPGVTDRRTIARLVELSGGNPLTLNALADSISLGEVLPPPASTTGTIPVEVAWRARLSTMSDDALHAAVVIALAEQVVQQPNAAGIDLLAGADSAIDELESVGAVKRRAGGVGFTHPLLRTTALDLAPADLVTTVAAELLDALDTEDSVAAPGTLVRLSHGAQRTGNRRHRELMVLAYDDAIRNGSWSAAGDLAEQLAETAVDLPERADWTARLGNARYNELDRDEATVRLVQAADLYAQCAGLASFDMAAPYRNGRAECLLLAMRNDFTRSGHRRHAEFDAMVAELMSDESIEPRSRAHAAAILAESSYASPEHDRRRQLVESAQALSTGVDDPLTKHVVHFATGLHCMAVLDLRGANESFTSADAAAHELSDSFWFAGAVARRGLVALIAGDPMAAVSDATNAADLSSAASNWSEHGMALAVRSVGASRLGRFADADNDTESTLLSARRADASDPFLASLSTAIWRRAVRGDEAGVASLRDLARQHQMYIPFAEYVAVALLSGVDEASDVVRPRWSPPRNGLSFRNLGFHLAQLEAAVLAGNLEVVDDLFPLFNGVYQLGVVASHDWPISIPLVMAAAAIELGDTGADLWVERSLLAAQSAGSVLEQAIADIYRALFAFAAGAGGQSELDLGRAALETVDALGAPLLARLLRERLTSIVGRLGMPSGRVRTVMFTDIVDSTRLMSSAGNAAWAVILGEHHRIVRTVVGRSRGSIMTATGDGFSAWFEQPADAADAARTLHQAIEHAALVVPGGSVAVRAGLASGSVFELGEDVSGMAVAEAARVMATAGPGETRVSRSVIDHGLSPAIVESVGVHSLKGLPAPLEIFALVPATSV